jgi:hypothetical protein
MTIDISEKLVPYQWGIRSIDDIDQSAFSFYLILQNVSEKPLFFQVTKTRVQIDDKVIDSDTETSIFKQYLPTVIFQFAPTNVEYPIIQHLPRKEKYFIVCDLNFRYGLQQNKMLHTFYLRIGGELARNAKQPSQFFVLTRIEDHAFGKLN